MINIREKLIVLLDSMKIVYRLFQHGKVITIADVEKELDIASSLMVKAMVVKEGEIYYLAALPGDRRFDRKKFSTFLGKPQRLVDLASAAETEVVTGLPIGAIPPFGLPLPVIIDQRLMAEAVVYCGLASFTESLQINPKDLALLSQALIVDISK